MELNQENLKILKIISEHDGFIKIAELSSRLKVSDRSIRYKINEIDDFLSNCGFEAFTRQHKKGIKLNDTPELKEFLERYLSSYTPLQYAYSKEERKHFMISEIIQTDEPVNISFFMTTFHISKNTVMKELTEIEDFFTDFDLKLIRKPRVGIYLEGSERQKRIALAKINAQMISVEDLFNYISTGRGSSKLNTLQFETLFSDIDLDYLDTLLKEIEVETKMTFSDEAYGSMMTHLVIMIKRIQMDKKIILIDAPIDSYRYEEEIRISENIIKKIEDHYHIKVPEEEINYLVLHLMSAKVTKLESDEENKEDELTKVIRKMVSVMEKIYGVCFKNPKLLEEGLLLHLRPAVNRIRFNLTIENPLFDDILLQYRVLFENTRLVTEYLEEYIGKPVSDHEVAYIMLHFGAAIRNSIENEKPYQVILVCGTGIGTANMVKSQLLDLYHIEVVNMVGAREVAALDKETYDLIISTITIPSMEVDQYIKINPLLLRADYEKLDARLLKRKRLDQVKSPVSITNLMEIIEKYAKVHEREQLQLELMMALANKEANEIMIKGKDLSHYLSEKNIKISVAVKDWKDTVDKATQILEDNNSVTPAYREAIKEKLDILGPYMVIAPGIALLHAETHQGVIETDFSLMTLGQGVRFGSYSYDPVRLVIAFSAKNPKDHLEALKDLTRILNDKENVLKMMNAKNKKEIIEILK